MEEASEVLGRTALACLADELAPSEAYERLVSTVPKLEARSLHASIADVLVRLALCARPPPPLLFAYIEAMCVYRTPSISVEDYDEQCIVVSLLSQLLVIKPADYGAVDTIARLILDAGGNAHVLEHLPIKNLIEAFKESTCNFWRAALRLVRDPKASGAQLFTRLVHGAMRDGWPLVHDEDALEVLLHDIQEVTARMDATHSHSQGPQSDAVRHALAALQHGVTASADDLFDEEMPTTTKTTLWSSTPFSPYMTALLQAWRESEGPGRRRVLPPQPPHPEPDLVLLVYTLSRLDMNWHSKCYTALGMLRTRCAPGSPASVERDATSVFLFELIVATNLCALQELRVDPCARTAQTWRHIFGGVQHRPSTGPPLVVSDMLTALCALYEPFQAWAALDVTATNAFQIPPLADAMRSCWSAWSLRETPSTDSTDMDPDNLISYASSSVQAYGQSVRECLREAPQRMDTFVPQALTNASLQYALTIEIRRVIASWTTAQEDMRRIVALCRSFEAHVPFLEDMLFLYLDPHELCGALEAVLSHMYEGLWKNADELALTGRAILFLELAASHCTRALPSTGEARAFFLLDMPVPGRESLPPVMRELLDRWCSELTGGQGISDTLLAVSPPWTLYSMAPAILSQLLDAHQWTWIDTQTLHSAVSYFLQAPLRHTLPATLRWLATYTLQTHTQAYYAPRLHAHVCTCLDVLQILLLSESCCRLICALVMPAVTPLLQSEQLATIPGTTGNDLRTSCQLVEAKYVRPRAVPHTWLAPVLSRDPADYPVSHVVAMACGGVARDTTTASTWLSFMQHTSPDDTWMIKLLGTALVLGRPQKGVASPPLALAHTVLSRWDASYASTEAIQRIAAVISMSLSLSKQLPGGPEAMQSLLYSFSGGALVKALCLDPV